jgi:HAD superfamily hydrolase (TIGR01549 family)
MRLRWVFLDVGNVLLDEDPLTYLSFARLVEAVRKIRPELTFCDVLARREAAAAGGSRWPVFEAVVPVLGEKGCANVWEATAREVCDRFAALSPLIPGADALVDRLGRDYRLGLIANQGREGRNRLASLGLLDRFEVVAFSEELGLFKPGPALYQHALDRSGARPGECLMIGDRLDNDIAPAMGLGMAGAWVRWPRRAAKGWDPAEHEARAYLASLERLAARVSGPAPTLAVDEISALDDAIRDVFHPVDS